MRGGNGRTSRAGRMDAGHARDENDG